MREIERAFKGNWGDYVANLIKENNGAVISIRIHGYLKAKKTRSATYSELHKQLKIPQSTLNEILKDNVEVGYLTKRYGDETKQIVYFLQGSSDKSQPPMLQPALSARDPIWFYVYDNPKLSPTEKVEIAIEYITYLLDQYSRRLILKQTFKLLKGVEPKTDYRLQDIENAVKINFEFAKKFGFSEELYNQIINAISPYDEVRAIKAIEYTKTKLKKYKLPTTTS